jgi:hypothetical protein
MGVAAHRRSRLRIGLVAPPSVRVPPRAYGGTELVIDQLARGLVAAGHDVTLFTTGDSTCPVERSWTHRHELGINGGLLPELDHVQAAYEELSDVDIIHDHTLLGPLWSHARDTVTPVVTTTHLPFTPELTRLYETVGTFAAVVAISHHQRASAPNVPVAAVIHHGIDVGAIPVGAGNGGYVLSSVASALTRASTAPSRLLAPPASDSSSPRRCGSRKSAATSPMSCSR